MWREIVIRYGWSREFESAKSLPESARFAYSEMVNSFIDATGIANDYYFGFVLNAYKTHYKVQKLSARLEGVLVVFETTYQPFSIFDLTISWRAVWHNALRLLASVLSSPFRLIFFAAAVYLLLKAW
jgi:hypothetical protein